MSSSLSDLVDNLSRVYERELINQLKIFQLCINIVMVI